jgi:hypothetical protein
MQGTLRRHTRLELFIEVEEVGVRHNCQVSGLGDWLVDGVIAEMGNRADHQI